VSSPPVVYNVLAPEKRNRLTAFFRLILVIPHLVTLLVYSVGAMFTVLGAWFVLMFTGKYPPGMYAFVASVLQYSARLSAYCYMQVDAYPSFALGPQEGYPVNLAIPPPLEKYNRVKVFFRVIIGIPVLVIGYAFGIVAEVMAIVVWLVAVVAGRTPAGLHSALNLGVSYSARYAAYFALLTEDWPAITQEEALTVDDGSGAPPSISATAPSEVPSQTFAAPEAPAPPPPPPPAAEERPPGPFGPSD
jgi:hypothetical protein